MSISDYIQIRSPVYVPHSAGRYAVKRFRKANCPIIERLTNSLMMHGRNNGKKLMAVRIVAHSFEIVSDSPPIVPVLSYHTATEEHQKPNETKGRGKELISNTAFRSTS